jgi:hypothetical protein
VSRPQEGNVLENLIVILFGAGAVICYWLGVRRGKAWAAPVVVICVLAAVATLAVTKTSAGRKLLHGPPKRELPGAAEARLVGQGLKGKLPEGARIVIFQASADIKPQEAEQLREQCKSALEQGAGASFNVLAWVTLPGGMGGMAEHFSGPLQAHPDLDGWVSLAGLPVDGIERMYGEGQHPLPAGAYVSGSYDSAKLRRWIEGGLLQAAVIKTKAGDLKLITASNLADLP